MKKGSIIALYSINNLGKTTQSKPLTERLCQAEFDAIHIKFPVYDLEPTGPIINNYLRKVNDVTNPYELSAREFQTLQVLNRTHFEWQMQKMLAEGKIVVAEDYVGTGIAWGVAGGVEKDFLVKLNGHLTKESFAILLDGKRFESGKEKDHVHEGNDDLTERSRKEHLALAEEHGWKIVDSSNSIEKVHNDIWNLVEQFLRSQDYNLKDTISVMV